MFIVFINPHVQVFTKMYSTVFIFKMKSVDYFSVNTTPYKKLHTPL
jgi:hypothetical protein